MGFARSIAAALIFVLVGACGAAPVATEAVPWDAEAGAAPPPPQYSQQYSGAGADPDDEATPRARGFPNDVRPDQTVPPYLPVVPSLPGPKLLPPQTPLAPAPNFSPGLPQGPVTNYGTGGLQAPPGAPPNPPYPAGGLGQ